MKRFSSVVVMIATAVAAHSAMAARPATCKAIEARIAQKAVEFVKVNAASYVPAKPANAMPSDFYHGVSKKNARLQEIADHLWDLRGDMANRNCRQAAAFTY